jgi:hypothetical protein
MTRHAMTHAADTAARGPAAVDKLLKLCPDLTEAEARAMIQDADDRADWRAPATEPDPYGGSRIWRCKF